MATNSTRVAAVAAALIVVSTGLVQGRWTGRWSSRAEVAQIASRVDRIPKRIGRWVGEDREFEPIAMRRAGIERAILRTYKDSTTGDAVTLLLVAGPPGPISVHTPDVCYEGAGYKMVDGVRTSSAVPAFKFAEFKSTGVIPETLHIYWGWNARGRWKATNAPRVTFALEPALFKAYVVRTARADESAEAGGCVRFLDEAIPAMGSLLGDTDDGAVATSSRS